MDRHDYAFPFRIDGSSRQAQQAPYDAHVDQMIRQVLLTAPGERADLPAFGCGLRQLIFAPHSEALDASTKVLVLQSLQQWLGTQITVQTVTVGRGEGDDAQLVIEIDYVLIETQTKEHIVVQVI
jgi:phage baseplate assembly protein W